MKYKDRMTINSWNKQIDKLDQPDSERKRRRERERALKDFSQSICLIVDKDWWNCVDQKEKSTLYSRWLVVEYRSYHSSQPLSLEEWIMSIKETIVIDKALYREKKINKVLGE
jgi:hypothetical protein